jgi:uncharacterized protein YqjF (DUF2071 family)
MVAAEDDLPGAGRAGMAAGVCPVPVRRPVMRQRWERLTFLHWPVDPAAVQRLLPEGLRVELFGGTAWVGLVPFFMRVATPGGRRVPWASNFCETNVRTYVLDRAGQAGIWFLSLDAARLAAVAVARRSYRLPYYWSAMRLDQRGSMISYACRRRWPGPQGAASNVRIAVGDRLSPAELDERDHFLTARWLLFSVFGHRLMQARASHQPWPLHRAQVVACDDQLIAAAGLPQPCGQPLAVYSPGVEVRIGRLQGAGQLAPPSR